MSVVYPQNVTKEISMGFLRAALNISRLRAVPAPCPIPPCKKIEGL